jgi:hypothetical protein
VIVVFLVGGALVGVLDVLSERRLARARRGLERDEP